MSEKHTAVNASGAGIETVAWLCEPIPEAWNQSVHEWELAATVKYLAENPSNPYWKPTHELVRRTDATRLLAESQAHNAKLEAQVGRLEAVIRRLMRSFPTDSDMAEAGWEPCEIEEACRAHDAARSALAASGQDNAQGEQRDQ